MNVLLEGFLHTAVQNGQANSKWMFLDGACRWLYVGRWLVADGLPKTARVEQPGNQVGGTRAGVKHAPASHFNWDTTLHL